MIMSKIQSMRTVQREQLVTWMKDNTTGNMRIRAGVSRGYI